MAFGLAYLDCVHLRGARRQVRQPPPKLGPQLLSPVAVAHGAESLLLPQPAPANHNTSISANQPIFCMISPFAGTVVETGRPCPQVDDWSCLAEAAASGLTSVSCCHVVLIAFLPVDVGFINLDRTQGLRETFILHRGANPRHHEPHRAVRVKNELKNQTLF